ncbi:hypothetical protein IGJ28_000710 [Enterococcus sp. AZ091]
MGIEIYNKPTIRYRIEGFSFFICNAWELMLKAHIINKTNEEAIYYKDNPNRTISLEVAIDSIFPDKHGNLRKNLLQIIELRNTSTHFITEDYEHIYAPLFQACVANFISKMQEFHGIDISEHIAQNFLTLSVRIDRLTTEEIKAKYSPSMAKKLISEMTKISNAIDTSNSDYAIPVETRFYITKNKKEADLFVQIKKDSQNTLNIVKDVKNPNDIYSLTTKDVIKIVNKRLKAKGVLLTKTFANGEQKETVFNKNDLQLFIDFYNIKSDEKYCFHYKLANRYGYNQALCDFLVEEIIRDPVSFISNLKKAKK